MMRTCSRCGETKPLDEFAVRDRATGRRGKICRSCLRAYGRQHYARNRPYYLDKATRGREALHSRTFEQLTQFLRAHPCVDCGETDVRVLQFDHVDPSTKETVVSRLIRNNSWERALEEIAKCVVRCANCHRRRTAAQFGYLRFTRVSRANIIGGTRE